MDGQPGTVSDISYHPRVESYRYKDNLNVSLQSAQEINLIHVRPKLLSKSRITIRIASEYCSRYTLLSNRWTVKEL